MKELKAEIPAAGILKNFDYGDIMYYTVTCQCGNPEDNIRFSVELEADAYDITLTTEFTPRIAYWGSFIGSSSFENSWLYRIDSCIRNIINALYYKLKLTYDIWFTGEIKYCQTTMMTEQQALNYAATINQSIKDLRKLREKEIKKHD